MALRGFTKIRKKFDEDFSALKNRLRDLPFLAVSPALSKVAGERHLTHFE